MSSGCRVIESQDCILIVEDDLLVGFGLAMALNIAGYRIVGPTGSADRALALAAAERPDVALVDIDLHGRADGVGVARTLGERHGTSVIFVTGRPERAREARNCALGVVTKPYDLVGMPRVVEVARQHRQGLPIDNGPRFLELFV
ncbi:MAG: response regulator [Geminicoccaceae bacterium]